MTALRWNHDSCFTWRSACGRFVIDIHPTKWHYLRLTDAATGAEYVCRTVDSAKANARKLHQGRPAWAKH